MCNVCSDVGKENLFKNLEIRQKKDWGIQRKQKSFTTFWMWLNMQSKTFKPSKMKNETIKNVAKEMLKELLAKCTEGQQLIFKRMYCHKNLELPINEAVDQMADDKIDWAMTQVERTVEKNNPTLSHVEVMKVLKDNQIKSIDYCIPDWNYEETATAICQLAPKAVSANSAQVEEIFNQHQVDVMRMSRGEISEGHLSELTNNLISQLAPKQVSEPKEPSQWISVEDRLPEINTAVLIHDGEGGEYPLYVDWTYKSSTGEILWYFGANYDEYENTLPATYTHWMPLPPAPEQEEGGEG